MNTHTHTHTHTHTDGVDQWDDLLAVGGAKHPGGHRISFFEFGNDFNRGVKDASTPRRKTLIEEIAEAKPVRRSGAGSGGR